MQTLTHAWLALMIDVSIKSLALAMLAGVGLAALRVRDTNLRHRVWMAVLLGMLLLPALVHVTPAVPLPRWMTVAMLAESQQPIAAEENVDRAPNHIPPTGAVAINEVVYSNDSAPGPFTDPLATTPQNALNTPRLSANRSEPQSGLIAAGKPSTKPVSARAVAPDQLLPILEIAYLCVAVAFAARLMIGLFLTRRLVAHAREITNRNYPSLTLRAFSASLTAGGASEARRVSEDNPRDSLRRRVRLFESERICVPATVGFFRPIVLLPACWRQWSESKLQAVLAHELAHVRRADWLVITLAELNRAVYWFHPLAWFLRRKLSELAERNCDDAVLEAESDRARYARHLLEVASLLTGVNARIRVPVRGVAMARKPNVETRIEAILDAGRPLARRLSAIGLAALVACGAIAILVTAAIRTSAEDKPQKPDAEMKMKGPGSPKAGKGDPAADNKQSAGDPKQQHVIGRVLDPDGKPVAGATVYVAWTLTGKARFFTEKSEDKVVAKTKSDAKGAFDLNFSLESPEPKRVSYGWKIIAMAKGFGPAWQRDVQVVKNGSSNSVVNLTLAQDQPVRGRIVDLEGTPLTGIHVRIHTLYAAPSEQAIVEWIGDAKKKPPPRNFEEYSSYAGGSMMSRPSRFAGPFPSAWDDGFLPHGSLALPSDSMTDSDGRVQFNQLGANRMAILEIEGKAIAKNRVQVVMRDMATVLAEPLNITGVRASTYFGRDFQFVAEPGQAIVGAVKDAETNEPLVNLQVNVDRVAGNTFSEQDFLSARTNDQGQYRIDGAPRGGGHAIAVNPAPDQLYFQTEKTLKTVSGLEPITCDFALNRGRWITGKVTDHESKAPIKGAMIDCLPLRSNPNAKDYPNYDPNIVGHAPSYRYFTDDDGSFRVLAIPGKGILGGIAMKDDEHTYMSLNMESVPKELVQENGYLTTYHPWTITGYHAIKEVQIPDSDEIAKCDLEFTRGLSRVVKIVDAQGKPAVGVRDLGRVFPPRFEQPASGSAIEIIGIRRNEQRQVVFIDPKRKIGKAIKLAAGDQTTVELQACAVARGRIVNDDRQPISGLPVKVQIDHPDNWSRELLGTTTGDDGRFEVLLPPGTTYHVSVYIPNQISVVAECRSTPGAVFELGDLTNETKLKADQTEKMVIKPAETATPKAATPKPETPASEAANPSRKIIHGQITGVDGKPAAGADVALLAARNAVGRGGDLKSRTDVLAEAKTDIDGRYQVEFNHVSSKTHQNANLIIRASGTALGWRKLNLDADDLDVSITLKPEQPVSGRLVDIEGQPAAHVQLLVGAVMAKSSVEGVSAESMGFYFRATDSNIPAAWPQRFASEPDGRFTVHGIPADQGVWLEVEGDDRFAPQSLVVNTGLSEQRGKRDGTYRPQVVKNLKTGEDAVLPLAPAKVFTGTVRYEDTGEPAPHARLTIWASQQQFGSMISISGKADEKGHYKIIPNPGIRFGVTAYPPDNTPYLVRKLEPVPWEDGATTRTVDVTLPRGVLVRGKILEEGSESPVTGAAVQYIPESANNSNSADSILTGWQDIHLSDTHGQFEIVVLPGPGRLIVHGPTNDYLVREISGRELDRGKPGWERNYVHGIERIEPAPKSAPLDVVVRLKPGAAVNGELADERGEPVADALIFSRLKYHPHSIFWRGFGAEAKNGRFEISGLDPKQEYPVCFLDSKRRLGATLIIRADMPPPRVILKACGAAKMRFVDDKGKPVPNYEPTIQFVMTPGELQYSEAARKSNAITADADFIANIDRANHQTPEKSDDHGELTVSALIPGATYRVVTYRNNSFVLSKEFQAVARQTLDLGEIVVERKD